MEINTCIIFYKFRKFETSEWEDDIDYGRYGSGRPCRSAADVIDQLRAYHRQSSFDFKISNIVCD